MVDHRDAQRVLEQAWSDTNQAQIVPPIPLKNLIEKVFAARSGSKGFKYVLVTGALAKAVSPEIHPRALQAGSSLRGAYDARSLCHKVVVSFEKTKGNLFGMSNEPFLSKPLRHPEHYKDNPQLRNKSMATALHDALELIREAEPEDVHSALVHMLRLGKMRSQSIKAAVTIAHCTLSLCETFLAQFLTKADGGARLVAIWASILKLTNEDADVRVYNPNSSDTYAKTTGDVEVFEEETLVSASECKHRPLNLDDIEHGLQKNRTGTEYVFVTAAGLQRGQESLIMHRIRDARKGADVSLIDAHAEFPLFLKMLGPHRRKNFGPIVGELLRNMKEFDCAEEAVDLWNNLVSKQ